jgi:hypothetical protein
VAYGVGSITAVSVALLLTACSSSDAEEEGTSSTTATTATETTAASTTAAPTTTEATATTEAAETTAAPETTTTTAAPAAEFVLAGDWFACEFVEVPGEAPTDGCATFDDDGLRFAEGGELSMIERVGGEEENCLFGNPGACFSADLTGIEIEAEPVGTWTLDRTTISVTTAGCTGTLDVEPGETQSVFRPGAENGCGVLEIDANAFDQAQAGGVYFGPYAAA